MISAAMAGGGVYGLLLLTAADATPAALAVLVGVFGVVVVPPGPPRAFVPVVGGAGAIATVLAAVAPTPAWGWTVAFAVATVGAWLGRWGPVGRAAGFVAFLATVLGLRIGLTGGEAIAGALSVLIATVAVVVTVRWIVPDPPAARSRRLVQDLTAQLSLMVDAAERLVAAGPGDRRERRLRLRLVAAQETAMLLDAAMDELADGARDEADDRVIDDVRRAVLDVEALADHVAWSALTVPATATPDERERLVGMLRAGRAAARRDDGDVGRSEPLVPRLLGHDDRLGEIVPRLGPAVRRLRTAVAALPRTRPARSAWGVGDPVSVRRVVVQTAVAGAGALGLGVLVSREEWHWALIGAYIVVTTTSSRGAGIRKAAERIVGTAVGVAAGLGAAALLAGRGVLLAALVAALATMIWFFQRSYVLFMFALTIAVALLYEVLGVLTPQLLALRLAETALGAVVAALVVAVVLPVPTRRTVDGAVEAVLAALGDVLDTLARTGTLDTGDVRDVDRAVSQLREIVAPAATGLPGGGGRRIRAARLLGTALRVRVTALATATTGAEALDEAERAALSVVRTRLRTLRQHLRGHGLVPDDPEQVPDGDSDVHAVLRAIDDRLAGYATSLGIALRHDPGALAAGSGRRLD